MNTRSIGKSALLGLFMGIAASDGWTDDAPLSWQESLGLNGSLRFASWSHPRCFTPNRPQAVPGLWVQAQPHLAEGITLVLNGRASGPMLRDCDAAYLDLREAYLSISSGEFDLKLGRQITRWGKSDAFSPTDVLSTRDLTLLTIEDADQLTGNTTVRASYHLGDFGVSAYWIPEFRPNTVPIPPLSPAIRLTHPYSQTALNQWALKFDKSGGSFDFSLSYYDGLDHDSDLTLTGVGIDSVDLALRHHRIRSIGLDAAFVLERFNLRIESAYAHTEDPDGTNPEIKNPYFSAVIGADRNLGETFNVNAQYLFRFVSNFQDPSMIADPLTRLVAEEEALLTNQKSKIQHGISLRISDRWLQDTLEAEIGGLLWLKEGDAAIRAKASYSFTDTLKAMAGTEMYVGPSRSFFGRLRELSSSFIELRYSF